jgi:hypothetical protein
MIESNGDGQRPGNDLDRLHDRIDALHGLVTILVTKVETRLPDADTTVDRILTLERVERSAANTALKLAAARAIVSWWPGALAGAAAGGVVAWILLAARIAGAH